MTSIDNNDVEALQLKRFLKTLDSAKGTGTSMVTLSLAPGEQIAKASHLVESEKGTADNIKSRVNKLSVLSALTSVSQKLKLYKEVPPTGLVVFSGECILENGKEKKLTLDVVPFRPINKTFYLCDSKFHTEVLHEILGSNVKYGYIVMDGNECSMYTLEGSKPAIHWHYEPDLPKKHGRGGQSKQRFERLGEEARHNYIKKCCEGAKQVYLKDNKLSTKAIFLGGCASQKQKFIECELLDPRLKKSITGIYDIPYGGKNGLQEMILMSKDQIGDCKLIEERTLLSEFMTKLSTEENSVVYGVKNTLKALEMGIVGKIILWEDLDTVKVEDMDLLDWMRQEQPGVAIHVVSDNSPEGFQFVKTFEGLGGHLRYKFDMESLEDPDDDDGETTDSDDDFI